MVEEKCAEVDAKQAAATLDDGQAQPRANFPKLNQYIEIIGSMRE